MAAKNCHFQYNINMKIVSLATYDKRYSYLKQTIHSICQQSYKFDKLVVNIPDNTHQEDICKFKDLLKDIDSRAELKLRDYRWRSANKLLWTAKEHPDSCIITCDDDIFYPKNFFEELYSKWLENKDCIIAHEISPVHLDNGKILHVNGFDIKLMQKTYGRYLSGCCLFPPHCLEGTEAYDFDKFFDVTNATHDELWFWCMTTLKQIKSIGLNCTMSFDLDQLSLPRDENSLSKINSDPYLRSYNEKINKHFGVKLANIVAEQTCEFPLNKDNFLAVCGNIQQICKTYGMFYHICFKCDDTILKSHLVFLHNAANRLPWKYELKIERQSNEQN